MRLTLNEKKSCNESKSNIRSRTNHSEEILKIFHELRAKKKEFRNNSHCEGVAKKLEDKIRSWIKIINRAYICSEGIEKVEMDLRVREAELARLEDELRRLEVGELDLYHRNYNETQDEVSRELDYMRTFTVGKQMVM